MAQISAPTPVQVAMFVESLPVEEQTRYDLETAQGLSAAMGAYAEAMAKGEVAEEKPRKAREAREFTILLIVKTSPTEATITVVGAGLGSPARESNDPTKWSDAKQLQSRAEIRAHKMQREFLAAQAGKPESQRTKLETHVLVLPTEEYLGKFFAA